MSLESIFRKKLIRVQFERTIGLFGATTIGVGALMGAGVYVLIGMAADAAGSLVWVSYLLCGSLAFLTTLLYSDLAKLLPVSGGGYAYSYKILGSFGGFIAGWFLALGSVFACALYAVGFSQYFSKILGYDLPDFGIKIIACILILGSTLLNAKGTGGSDKIQSILTWGNIAILVLLILFSSFNVNTELIKPSLDKGVGGIWEAISIIYISFFGYQLIANNTDEIKNPKKTVPKSMKLSMIISFTLYLLIALISIAVIDWKELANSNAPLVLVASKSFGKFGFLLISLGGVLAAASALNSTILSQGRQIYTMGTHRFLPASLGKIHEVNKTPQIALLSGGIFVLIAVSLFDLEFIAKSANFCLLISLLPVSLALRKFYRKNPNQKPKNIFKRSLPEITLITNALLLFSLDYVSLLFGLQLGIIGLIIYYFYSKKSEYRSRSGVNITLSEKKTSFLSRGIRILVPVANPKTLEPILTTSKALLQQSQGELVALSVVNTPEQTDFYAALSEESKEALERIEQITKLAEQFKITVKPVIRASHSLSHGIVHAAEEESCNLIVMGYSGQHTKASATIMEEVLHKAKTDIIFLKLNNIETKFEPSKIGISLGSTLNLDLIINLAGSLAETFKGKLYFYHILPENYTRKQKDYAGKVISEAIETHIGLALYNIRLLTSNNPLEELVSLSKDLDLIVTGATKVGLLEKATIGSFASQLAEQAHCSVAIVKTVSAAKKIISTIKPS